MPIVTKVNELQNRRTKIIATLGPASDDESVIEELINQGVNIFRFNMSHGDHDYHAKNHALVRKVAQKLNQTVGILVDLCGPKIRVGKFEQGSISIQKDEQVIVTTRKVIGRKGLIPSQYKLLSNELNVGDHILLADGLMELEVTKKTPDDLHCIVINGGILSDHKGINLPNISLSIPSITEKDKKDINFALQLDIDFVALSFVRAAEDINQLRELMADHKNEVHIIAKIEKPEALEAIDDIIATSDGIMIARGDLGIELKPEHVPIAQDQLIEYARRSYTPVIVATQMLESMIENPNPTRAEVTDIAHAVTLHADAIMLSGETAIGKHVVEAVSMMDRIARQTESYLWRQDQHVTEKATQNTMPIWSAVSQAMKSLASNLKVHAVIVLSKSGMSAKTISSERPSAPIIVITDNQLVCQKLILLWGVIPVYIDHYNYLDASELAKEIAKEKAAAQVGDHVLLIKGFHNTPALNIPSVTVITV